MAKPPAMSFRGGVLIEMHSCPSRDLVRNSWCFLESRNLSGQRDLLSWQVCRQSLMSCSVSGRLGRVRGYESRGQLRVGDTFSFFTPMEIEAGDSAGEKHRTEIRK